jgi:hypothetical protein
MRRDRSEVQPGVIIEDCGLHVCAVIEVNHETGDMKTRSLFTGDIRGCDLYHCGIEVQSPEEIAHKLNLFKTGGMKEISAEYHRRFNDKPTAKHPVEFKPDTWYWVQFDSGGFMPFLYNVEKSWKFDHYGYIPHDKFMELMRNTRIIEAVPPLVPKAI